MDTAYCAALQYAVGYRAESLLLVQADRSDEIRYLRDRYGAAVHRGIQHPARSVARLRGGRRRPTGVRIGDGSAQLPAQQEVLPRALRPEADRGVCAARSSAVRCRSAVRRSDGLAEVFDLFGFGGYICRLCRPKGANRFGRIGEVGHPPWTIIVRRHKITGLWSLKL